MAAEQTALGGACRSKPLDVRRNYDCSPQQGRDQEGPPEVKGIDLSVIPTRGLGVDLARWSNAFGGKGLGSRKGVEQGRLRLKGDRLTCTWDAGFEEFGKVRFRIQTSLLVNGNKIVPQETDWRDEARKARVKGLRSGNGAKLAWIYEVEDAQGSGSLERPIGADALPTTFQWFIPILMKRKVGETVSFSSLPEDAFPWWRPRAKGSFFPLDGSPSLKEIRCKGVESLKRGKESISGWAFEQHGENEAERWWWVSESGDLLAMAWKKTLWIPEEASVVKSELASARSN